jgi:hypothetical protein
VDRSAAAVEYTDRLALIAARTPVEYSRLRLRSSAQRNIVFNGAWCVLHVGCLMS